MLEVLGAVRVDHYEEFSTPEASPLLQVCNPSPSSSCYKNSDRPPLSMTEIIELDLLSNNKGFSIVEVKKKGIAEIKCQCLKFVHETKEGKKNQNLNSKLHP